MEFREGLLYSEDHEWVLVEGDVALVWITDYAQNEMGDLVFVNLPEEGDEMVAGEAFADVESVKAVSDVLSPVDGTVAEINEELLDSPEKINEGAFDAWFVKVSGFSGEGELMDAAAYKAYVEGLE